MVTLSSTEAEYVALSFAVTEIVYLRKLLHDMELTQLKPTVDFEDNLSCIKMIYGDLNHKTTKHINARYHYTKDLVSEGVVTIEHLETTNMIADVLTKALPVAQHQYLASLLLNYPINI